MKNEELRMKNIGCYTRMSSYVNEVIRLAGDNHHLLLRLFCCLNKVKIRFLNPLFTPYFINKTTSVAMNYPTYPKPHYLIYTLFYNKTTSVAMNYPIYPKPYYLIFK